MIHAKVYGPMYTFNQNPNHSKIYHIKCEHLVLQMVSRVCALPTVAERNKSGYCLSIYSVQEKFEAEKEEKEE